MHPDYLIFQQFLPSESFWSEPPPQEPLGRTTPLLWPCDLVLRDVRDLTYKKELCCCIRNKPFQWTAENIQRYIEEYFRFAVMPVPTIVGCTIPAPHTALVSCYDEHSADRLIQTGQLLLPAAWAAINEQARVPQMMDVHEWIERRGDETDSSTEHRLIDRPLVTWPSGHSLKEVQDISLRSRLCAFAFNKPLEWDGSDVQKLIEATLENSPPTFGILRPNIVFVAANPKASYAVVVCHDEASRARVLTRREIALPAELGRLNKDRGFPPVLEMVPLHKDANWSDLKQRYGAQKPPGTTTSSPNDEGVSEQNCVSANENSQKLDPEACGGGQEGIPAEYSVVQSDCSETLKAGQVSTVINSK